MQAIYLGGDSRSHKKEKEVGGSEIGKEEEPESMSIFQRPLRILAKGPGIIHLKEGRLQHRPRATPSPIDWRSPRGLPLYFRAALEQ